jgi:hypothetical protein
MSKKEKNTMTIKELEKIARINGRKVQITKYGIGTCDNPDGADSFIGTMDDVVEWEKGYNTYKDWEKNHD